MRLPCACGDDPSTVYDGRRDAAHHPCPARRTEARAGTIRQDWRLETT
ncbi:hypothetical protein [Streptomyces boncukensis]|uniref:Uncharacterized protein n=1 Tax=Streptomyces boncukensis TaxID=2711219 RepID=A0A6G4WV85_9ACTN|nr:hypothetical protein [Streptomyces boncukensis]NGO68381.1 hypothetical protein [Streptomyces boncukensis]